MIGGTKDVQLLVTNEQTNVPLMLLTASGTFLLSAAQCFLTPPAFYLYHLPLMSCQDEFVFSPENPVCPTCEIYISNASTCKKMKDIHIANSLMAK